jgi:hypothetical protein
MVRLHSLSVKRVVETKGGVEMQSCQEAWLSMHGPTLPIKKALATDHWQQTLAADQQTLATDQQTLATDQQKLTTEGLPSAL